jgi:hypothetical protein
MDRRARKLEKKRRGREQTKKKAAVLAARRPDVRELMVRSAAREEFGPCFVSATWDNLESPALVSVIVTRQLAGGQLMPGTALVDRACLGIKDGFALAPMSQSELSEFVDRVGLPHGGMVSVSPLVVQSIVFHAIDYARAFGFEPHRDFPAALFGPRPPELLATPWHAPERPIYLPGPHDDVRAITSQLAKTCSTSDFEQLISTVRGGDEASRLRGGQDDDDTDEVIHSPLECSVSRDKTRWLIFIYRGVTDAGWILELEDHHGTSFVWDNRFETDRTALDAALRAIERNSVESFGVEGDATPVSVSQD